MKTVNFTEKQLNILLTVLDDYIKWTSSLDTDDLKDVEELINETEKLNEMLKKLMKGGEK